MQLRESIVGYEEKHGDDVGPWDLNGTHKGHQLVAPYWTNGCMLVSHYTWHCSIHEP